jgi:hypothetical protein
MPLLLIWTFMHIAGMYILYILCNYGLRFIFALCNHMLIDRMHDPMHYLCLYCSLWHLFIWRHAYFIYLCNYGLSDTWKALCTRMLINRMHDPSSITFHLCLYCKFFLHLFIWRHAYFIHLCNYGLSDTWKALCTHMLIDRMHDPMHHVSACTAPSVPNIRFIFV